MFQKQSSCPTMEQPLMNPGTSISQTSSSHETVIVIKLASSLPSSGKQQNPPRRSCLWTKAGRSRAQKPLVSREISFLRKMTVHVLDSFQHVQIAVTLPISNQTVIQNKGFSKEKRSLFIYFLASSFSISLEFIHFLDVGEAQRIVQSFF